MLRSEYYIELIWGDFLEIDKIAKYTPQRLRVWRDYVTCGETADSVSVIQLLLKKLRKCSNARRWAGLGS